MTTTNQLIASRLAGASFQKSAARAQGAMMMHGRHYQCWVKHQQAGPTRRD
jgi:hypothetical protein